MTERLRVTVTQEDIDRGVRGAMKSCPLALALRRSTRADVWVNAHVALRTGFSAPRTFQHSNASLRFVKRFDNGKPVHPATFILTRKETPT